MIFSVDCCQVPNLSQMCTSDGLAKRNTSLLY